jgi:lipid A 3-O-deacylase
LAFFVAALSALGVEGGDVEGHETPSAPKSLTLWRLEWDNDGFVHKDNAFTNGWSLQRHSPAYDSWGEMEPSKFSGWISRTIPGIGGGGGRVVKRGSGLSQITMTPEDIQNPDPQPGDVPWAGALGWSESWYAFDNLRLNAFQIYAGILGPYSFAEQFQIQIHHWINADEPRGWDNQLKTEPLVNLNYVAKRKLVMSDTYWQGFGADLAVGGEVGLGNFSTFAEFNLEVRIGWALPEGFLNTPDPGGDGIMLNPITGVPGGFHVYLSIAARAWATAYTVFFDGNTFRESPHPGLEYDTVTRGAVIGLHFEGRTFSVHLNFYSYENLPFESVNPLTDMTWGNITLEYRF